MQTCCLRFTNKVLRKDMELLVTKIYVSMFSETQNLFCFLPEMGESSPKELFKIARCFRSYFVSLFESFQKVTERSRMVVTIQTRILNTFSTQGTKIVQSNIMCVSNFHMHMFGNVLKFWCYDPNLHSPGQGGFYFFPSVHHFLTYSCLIFTEFSSACNLKQASQSPVLPRGAEHIFCDSSFSFLFFFVFTEGEKEERFLPVYLWQWIIQIFIITQPYGLCTKRETKVEMALPREITWLPFVNLCGFRSCLTDKVNREYNIL